ILGGLGRQGALGDDYVDLHLDQFGCHASEPLGSSLREAYFEDDVLALHIAVVPQTLPETFKSRHRRCDRHREDSDLGDPLCLLRLGGERHDEETGSYRADESTPIHNSITRRMEVQPCYAYTRDLDAARE